MKALIIYASRYGSTEQAADWIADRFSHDGISVSTADVKNAELSGGHDIVLLGSGIYSHGFLPEMEHFICENAQVLSVVKTVLFGVAMQTEAVISGGRPAGGVLMLAKYAEKLGKNCISGAMLHGEMVYSKMTEDDRLSLDKFYSMLNFSNEEIKRRQQPRSLMRKTECWDFAEKLISRLAAGGDR
jgi:menaquinone-dependent protoporphyrinogen oxidase